MRIRVYLTVLVLCGILPFNIQTVALTVDSNRSSLDALIADADLIGRLVIESAETLYYEVKGITYSCGFLYSAIYTPINVENDTKGKVSFYAETSLKIGASYIGFLKIGGATWKGVVKSNFENEELERFQKLQTCLENAPYIVGDNLAFLEIFRDKNGKQWIKHFDLRLYIPRDIEFYEYGEQSCLVEEKKFPPKCTHSLEYPLISFDGIIEYIKSELSTTGPDPKL